VEGRPASRAARQWRGPGTRTPTTILINNPPMNPILRAGVAIGVLCSAWMFVMGFTGWYKNPVLANAFFLVIAIEVGGLLWGLRRTAAEGRPYVGQIVDGTLMAIVAGVLIVASSLVFTMVAFPDYFHEREQVQRQELAAEGRTAAEIETAIAGGRAAETPMANAMAGFIGTLITGILASAVIAIWTRAP
jgi:hypothetical protein